MVYSKDFVHFFAGGRLGHGMRSSFYLMLYAETGNFSKVSGLASPYAAAVVVIVFALSLLPLLQVSTSVKIADLHQSRRFDTQQESIST